MREVIRFNKYRLTGLGLLALGLGMAALFASYNASLPLLADVIIVLTAGPVAIIGAFLAITGRDISYPGGKIIDVSIKK